MISISTELDGIEVGLPQSFRNLTIRPLFRKSALALPVDYQLLDEAIAAGTARVTELHEGGSVPELRFENLGSRPVLLVDGQELIGAKQNRVLNLTILSHVWKRAGGILSERNSNQPITLCIRAFVPHARRRLLTACDP